LEVETTGAFFQSAEYVFLDETRAESRPRKKERERLNGVELKSHTSPESRPDRLREKLREEVPAELRAVAR
jgi:hypothetical protein